jgi:hypothetical protein
VQADYTKQLAEIVAALRQPTPWWTNSWILATFSAVLGMLGGFVGQLILQMHAERQTRKTVLRLCYRYTGALLVILDVYVSVQEPLRQHKDAALPLVLPATPEEYIVAHREIYAALQEAPSFDVIFKVSRKLEQPSDDYDYINAALQTIVIQFVMKRLTLKGVAKYQNKEETQTFAGILARHEPTVRDLYPPR